MLVEDTVKQTDSHITSPTHRAWIEDGILYNEYQGEISVARVMENEEKSMQLITEQKIKILPMIVIFKDIDKTRFKLSMADYGKVISAFDLSKRISGAWIVGASHDVKRLVDVVNKVFFSNKMHFVQSNKEAQEAALLFSSSSESILDRE